MLTSIIIPCYKRIERPASKRVGPIAPKAKLFPYGVLPAQSFLQKK